MNARNSFVARMAMVALETLMNERPLRLLPRERKVRRRPDHARDYAGVVGLYGKEWQDNMAAS